MTYQTLKWSIRQAEFIFLGRFGLFVNVRKKLQGKSSELVINNHGAHSLKPWNNSCLDLGFQGLPGAYALDSIPLQELHYV